MCKKTFFTESIVAQNLQYNEPQLWCMNMEFKKILQFSLLIKTGDRLREFNFNKGDIESRLQVNVCTDNGDRIFFRMERKEDGWEVIPGKLPPWLTLHQKQISGALEEELKKW